MAGQFTIDNLKWGTYRLTETKAPNGYSRSDKEYIFTITQENAGKDDIQIQVNGTNIEGNKIPNEPGVTLPSAGESGILHVVAIGIGVTVLGLIGFEIITRKRAA